MSTPERHPAEVQTPQPEINLQDATTESPQPELEVVSSTHPKQTKRVARIVIGRWLHSLKMSIRQLGGQRLAKWVPAGRLKNLRSGLIASYAIAGRHPRLAIVVSGSGVLALCLLFFWNNPTDEFHAPKPAQSTRLDEVKVFPPSSKDNSRRALPTAIDVNNTQRNPAPESNGHQAGGPRFPHPHGLTQAAPPGRAVWLKGTIEAVNGGMGGSPIQPISFQDWPPVPRRADIVPPPKRFQRDYR